MMTCDRLICINLYLFQRFVAESLQSVVMSSQLEAYATVFVQNFRLFFSLVRDIDF